jgi:hypothetical protein
MNENYKHRNKFIVQFHQKTSSTKVLRLKLVFNQKTFFLKFNYPTFQAGDVMEVYLLKKSFKLFSEFHNSV